ncbi:MULTISPECIES: NYN domain-containing protein [unclassified Blastococcus]|uniref:NYN domain-containing protein n=1 Tax=unclassified Blastococcus TaxID=2619396 RepID=UPI001EF013D0|nr:MULTISPECIES: NYN domain-containing protein [unclassified Blastococcus]
MDRTVLLVDAGNLLAAGGNLTVANNRRHDLDVRIGPLLNALTALVAEHARLPLLRTYWYDASREGRLTAEHEAVRGHPYTKLRLGRLVGGAQKGVDALVYRDLTTLARQRSVASAYLLAGDEDLREGVAEAQSLGVQVILLAVEPAGNSKIADALLWEVDDVLDLDRTFLAPFFAARGAGPGTEAGAVSDSP